MNQSVYLMERKPGFAFPEEYLCIGAISSTDSYSWRWPKL